MYGAIDYMDSFRLEHCGNIFWIYDFKYNAMDAQSGNPYNTTFNIKVVSGLFSGIGECEYDMKEFIVFARQINELYDFRRTKVVLHDICYGSCINFEMNKTGHLIIKGDIYGCAMVHSLKFEFFADQTSLKDFATALKKIYSV